MSWYRRPNPQEQRLRIIRGGQTGSSPWLFPGLLLALILGMGCILGGLWSLMESATLARSSSVTPTSGRSR